MQWLTNLCFLTCNYSTSHLSEDTIKKKRLKIYNNKKIPYNPHSPNRLLPPIFPLCKSLTKNISYCLNVIAAVLIATVSLSFGTFTGLIDALRSKRVRREHHYTMCQSLHLKIWFFLIAVKLIKELLLMSWHIKSASSFSLALLGRHSFYTPLTFDPLMCNNCVRFINFLYLFSFLVLLF